MIQGKYSIHNTPAQEIACPCEYSEVLHKQFSCPLYLPFLVSWCRIFGKMSKNNSYFSHQKIEIVIREDQKAEVVSLIGN